MRRFRLILALCNRFKSTPDNKIPARYRHLFRFLKTFVATQLVRIDSKVRAAYEANERLVVLTNRPPPRSHPSCGVWVGFANTRGGSLECTAQTYMFPHELKIMLVHTSDRLSLERSHNTSIATEEAQLLLHLSQCRA